VFVYGKCTIITLRSDVAILLALMRSTALYCTYLTDIKIDHAKCASYSLCLYDTRVKQRM